MSNGCLYGFPLRCAHANTFILEARQNMHEEMKHDDNTVKSDKLVDEGGQAIEK